MLRSRQSASSFARRCSVCFIFLQRLHCAIQACLEVFSHPTERLLKQLDDVRRMARPRMLRAVVVLELVGFLQRGLAPAVLQVRSRAIRQQLPHDVFVSVHGREVQCAIAMC